MGGTSKLPGVDAGYSALVGGCALAAAPLRDWLVVSGEDRLRFVNGLVTCDVRDVQPGDGVYGFVTSSQGRILADVVITATPTSLVLDLPAGRASSIAAHMLRYKVADRVDIRPVEALEQIVVAGPDSGPSLERVGGTAPGKKGWGCSRIGSLAFHRERRLGVEATRVLGPEADVSELAAKLEDLGAVRVGPETVAVARVERGVPWCDVDFGEENFPQETGLEGEAVSYTKGCYLGQEIVARIHYRGHVNRSLRGLSGDGTVIEAGCEIFSGGEGVGVVTSAVVSPALAAPIALAIVHRKAGDYVTLADGSRLTLSDLPFVERSG